MIPCLIQPRTDEDVIKVKSYNISIKAWFHSEKLEAAYRSNDRDLLSCA